MNNNNTREGNDFKAMDMAMGMARPEMLASPY
jgi:hypothetical protein